MAQPKGWPSPRARRCPHTARVQRDQPSDARGSRSIVHSSRTSSLSDGGVSYTQTQARTSARSHAAAARHQARILSGETPPTTDDATAHARQPAMPKGSGRRTSTRRGENAHKGIAAHWVTILFNRRNATQHASPIERRWVLFYRGTIGPHGQHESQGCGKKRNSPPKGDHHALLRQTTAMTALSVRQAQGERIMTAALVGWPTPLSSHPRHPCGPTDHHGPPT